MLQGMLRDCSTLCNSCGAPAAAAVSPLRRPWRLFAAGTAASAGHQQTDAQPAAAAAADASAAPPTEQQQQASASSSPSDSDAEVPELKKKKKKKKKKDAPWPELVAANGPLPAAPEAWQNAAVLVDKPLGWTSFDVCGKLRGALRIKKIGHAGTLDPQATGLLIICVGKGCKQVDTFVAMDKVYSGTLRLGEATPSLDSETEVSRTAEWRHLSDADLAAARDDFLGETSQLPPMYSAIRIKGQRLYMAARAGEEIEREPRAIKVSQFDLWRDEPGAQDVNFRVRCSKGTYIRSLAADLGEAVGSAAHLVGLRREAIGRHHVDAAWQLTDLVAAIHESREALGVPALKPISTAAEYADWVATAAAEAAGREGDPETVRR